MKKMTEPQRLVLESLVQTGGLPGGTGVSRRYLPSLVALERLGYVSRDTRGGYFASDSGELAILSRSPAAPPTSKIDDVTMYRVMGVLSHACGYIGADYIVADYLAGLSVRNLIGSKGIANFDAMMRALGREPPVQR